MKTISTSNRVFSNAMEVCDNLNDKYRYSLSLGRVYSEVGQKKKAEDCFVSCINATNIFVSSGAYYYWLICIKRW